MKRAVFVLGLGAVLVAGNIAAAQPVPPDPRINDARRDLQDARRLALEERYEDAVAEAEAALATLIELRDDDTVLLPDLSVLALNGDGNRVVITIRNNGTEDVHSSLAEREQLDRAGATDLQLGRDPAVQREYERGLQSDAAADDADDRRTATGADQAGRDRVDHGVRRHAGEHPGRGRLRFSASRSWTS